MNVALILLAYGVAVAVLGPLVLRRAVWLDRAPRLAILCWQSLSAAVVGAAVLAGLTVVIPVSAPGADLAQFLNACVLMVRAAYATPGGALVATVGLVVSVGIIGRLLYGISLELVAAGGERRRHVAVLEMVARRDTALGALVLDHDIAAAYCLPGGGGRIVLTTSTLAALDDRQLAAVLAHERAHLRGHHHLVVAVARGVKRAFPRVLLFRLAAREIGRLTELAADDVAVKAADRLTVADALLRLADGQVTPRSALAASGRDTGHRVRRLLVRTAPLKAAVIVPAGVLALAAAVTPLIIAVTPAVVAAAQDYCMII
ncbi:M56 family metallopeptidase [Nonomuraea sp. NBC_00507]|uniref:M56 family metallopeptidase n=1 Tax=Nonomuraea sp. NBC_00507 TaxID=2976002 RepID=UPI002E1872F9